MLKRMISALLVFLLLLSASIPVSAAEAETEADVCHIASLAQFLTFAKLCRLDSYSQGLTVSLDTDLDLTNTGFRGIPIFCGTFYGNGYTIRGLNLQTEGSVQGLFRYLTDTALVQDLHLQGVVHPEGTGNEAGALAGSNAGRIVNCSFSGLAEGHSHIGGLVGINGVSGILENCRMEGTVSGSHFVGGIAGENRGVIRACTNDAMVNSTAIQNRVELADITLESLTNSEAANTVTDIGGIAGSSIGVIRSCINRGDVGYPQMGYNIGGIAGTQSGYVVDCANYGTIQGRKEVGGIVGQMEPTTLIEYKEDTLQILQRQLDGLRSAVSDTASNVQGGAYGIYGQIGALVEDVSGAEEALLELIPEEPGKLPDKDAFQAAENALSSTLSDMTDTLRGMSATTESMVGTLSNNLYAIQNQMNAMQTTLGNAAETLGGSIADVSDEDTSDNFTGKAERCKNYGEVLGDLNVGGITGAMAMENDLDHEEDVEILGDNSLNFSSEIRCVILDCENEARITAKKQYAGGIVGLQSMGLVKRSYNSGTLDAQGANYVGGISGQSEGYIRFCGAKCVLSGGNHVGGIAGSATVATDCLSMVQLKDGSENLGAILGSRGEALFQEEEEEPITRNCYVAVDRDLGGIDGISYHGSAEPESWDIFLAREELPEMFTYVQLCFRYENGGESRFHLVPGSAFPVEKIPVLPQKDGYIASWEGLEKDSLRAVTFDRTYEAEYRTYDGVLSSSGAENGKPLILLQGGFTSGSELEITDWTKEIPLEEGQTLLKAKSFAVRDAHFLSRIRFCVYDLVEEKLALFLLGQDGTWRQAETELDGSYLVAELAEGDHAVALVLLESFPWVYPACGALALAVIAGARIYRKRRRSEAK